MAVLRKLIKKIFTRALPLLTGLAIATTSQAFDAGPSDPNLRKFDSLVNGTGGDNCRIEVGYLQASQNLTQLLVVTKRSTTYNQYHYNGGYYRSSNNTWSSSESSYFRSTTGVIDDLTTMSASTLATDCGWTSATITDLTPSSGFGASGTSFAAADTASIRLDYVYNGRSFSATATISGGASDVPTVSSSYTGTPGAPTSLVATPQNGSASIAFTAPSDLPSDPNESDNSIANYEYSLDGGSTWVALSPAVASSPVVISGLTNGTSYSVSLRGVNGVGTGIASSSVSVVPADTTAPTFDTAPSVSSVTSFGFTPSASIDEAGVIYYVVVADGDTAPSVAQVKAGNNSSDTAAAAAASSTVSSSPFDSSFSAITSLTGGTAYDAYFVGADDESTPNDQSSVTKVEITTLAQAGCDLSGYLGPSYSNFTSPISADSTASFYFRTAMRTAASNGDDITGCDVSGIQDFSQLFYNRTSFDQDISNWDVSSGTNFSYMLANTSFDSDISGWDMGSATNIAGMFASNTAFNRDISSWDVSSVTLFNQVFSGASFNQDISSWDVSSGTTFRAMFENNTVFDNDISSWSVQSGADLQSMFNGASAFKTTFSVDNTPPLSFFTGDVTAPTLASSSPSDDATGVAVDANIVLTFSEAVDAETGNIVLKQASDGSTIETFDVTSAVTGSGTTTITINPTSDLASSTTYYVEIASTAFDDAAGNSYAGIADATTLNFETADVNAPTLASSSPSDDATGVAVDANIVLTFSEAVDAETGNIVLKQASDGSTIETFDVTSAVTGSGTTTITINPTSDLASSTTYYVEIASTAFDDAAGNSYAGIADATTLNFETADVNAPTVALTSNANDPHSGVFTVTATFSESVTGFTADDITVVNGTKGSLSGSGTTYTMDITPSSDGAVTVDVAANVAQDAAGNNNTAATQLSVTTDGTAPTVALTSDASNPHSGVFTVIATFSESVTGFALGDVTVGNGTAGNLSGSGTTYTFDVTPTADGTVTVDIAADVATDDAANGNTAATQLSVTTDMTAPRLSITGPLDVVTEDFTVTFTFSESVIGFTAEDVTVTNGTKGAFAEPTLGSIFTLVITPELGTTVSVFVDANKTTDAAGNSNEASNTFEVSAGSPAAVFDEHRAEIRQVIVDEASRSLRSGLVANRRMVQGALKRFAGAQGQAAGCLNTDDERISDDEFCSEIAASSRNVPFDVTGNLTVSGSGLNTSGNFFQQLGNEEGTYRRLFFGDFDVQHDADTDSTTATLTGRMVLEQMTSEQTMLGYFIGGELATSTIGGSFEGDQDRIGVTAGGYVVHELSEQVYFDGFASLGAGRNNLEMANDVLALESEYTTQTATLGGAITGVYSQKGYDFKPELAFSYGKTWLGDVGFTGRAYGLVDNTLSLDAGDVSIANLTFRPEVIVPISADFVADTNTQLSFAPRLVCEQIKSTTNASDCGTGGELGFSSTSEDGLSSAEMRVLLDRINGGTRSRFAFSVEHKF